MASQDAQGAVEHLLDGLTDASPQDRPAQVAWILIYKALIQTIKNLSINYKDLISIDINENKINKLSEEFSDTFDQLEVGISFEFFTHPNRLSLLEDIKPALIIWLKNLGMNEQQACSFHLRIKDNFTLAIHQEWLKTPKTYACIEQAVTSPFINATQVQRERMLYSSWLQEQINERMFNEAFSLKQVYVPLRAYYKEKRLIENKKQDESNSTDTKIHRIVVDLHSEMLNWVKMFDTNKAIRVICGGPGSGKSSFGKMFAAEITKEHPEIPILFIPLHLFDPTDDLISGIEKYLKGDRFLTTNFLDTKNGNDRLLLIFDGLDELSQQGKAASELAHNFIDEVTNQLSRFNLQGSKFQAIVTGREITIQNIQARLRGRGQILYTMPFYLTEAEIKEKKYDDEEHLLKIDQRIIWWEKYSIAKGRISNEFPDELNISSLTPLTREPLLNYLVALSYERGKINFDDETTLNEIYEDLLCEIHNRQWERGRTHSDAKDLTKDQFFRILEEIALAVWHGDGRTATVEKIIKQCKQSSLKQYLDIFQEGAKKGMTRLLTAFYFRQSEQLLVGEKTFEFTHKSFGEYLTAKRIVRLVGNISKNIINNIEDPDSGYDEKEALKKWAELCGPTPIDKYLNIFIQNEISISKSELSNWQETYASLLGHASRHGLPMEKITGLTFKEAIQYSQNAEEALLAIHCSCAIQTQKNLKIKWGDINAFRIWINRIQAARQVGEFSLAMQSLGYLNLSGACFDYINLYSSNLNRSIMSNISSFKGNYENCELEYVSFENAELEFSNFNLSIFSSANLNHASLYGSTFDDAEFYYSSLVDTDLGEASFKLTIIQDCDFSKVDLNNANFKSSTMHSTSFEEANFEMANLYKAKSYNCNFKKTNLNGANLKHAVFENANLQKASLYEANFEMAHLKDADFRGAKLRGANFKNANLKGANFEGTNLESANFEGAYLENTNFKDANLSEAKIQDIDIIGAYVNES